jgi:hypothetical protein
MEHGTPWSQNLSCLLRDSFKTALKGAIMLKLTGFLSVALTSGFAFLWLALQQESSDFDSRFPPGWMDLTAIQKRAEKLDADLSTMRQFVALRETIFQALARHELSLRDACQQVYRLSRDIHPFYCWQTLAAIEGTSCKEKMGRTILREFEMKAIVLRTTSAVARSQQLASEFASPEFQEWLQLADFEGIP